jgi:hypothetical protein
VTIKAETHMADFNHAISLDDFLHPKGSELLLAPAELAAELAVQGGDQEDQAFESFTNRFFQFIGVTIGIVIFTVILRQPTDADQMRQDLHRLTMEIETTNIRLEKKEYLLDQIDAIRHRLHAGASIPAASWLEAKESIESLLQGKITDDKTRLIERQLDRITREINETEK